MLKRLFALMIVGLMASPLPVSAQYVMDVGSLINALRFGDFSGDLDNLDRAQSVYVTRLTQIAGSGSATLDRTIASRAGVLRYLRAIIGQNRLAMKALAIHHEALEDVIFLTTTNDGTAMLYVDNR